MTIETDNSSNSRGDGTPDHREGGEFHKETKTSTTPSFDLYLSRPAYRLGTTVVGTVCFQAPRGSLRSAQTYVAGRCRIDPRWQNPEKYQKLYGIHPYLESVQDVETKVVQSDMSNTVCFWATNVVNLLDLPERTVGVWKDVKPKPLLKPPNSPDLYFEEQPIDDEEQTNDDPAGDALERRYQLFTFRVDLPIDLPHTASETSCRYSYSVVVHATTKDGKVLFRNVPFVVLSPDLRNLSSLPTESRRERVRCGTCVAMAHSVGLPCHVSPDELYTPKGQLAVRRHTVPQSQTLRIANPHGTPCCVLTALGASVTHAGATVLLQFDLPSGSASTWIPCYQISACLEGQEDLIQEDSTTKRRTRNYLLDTAHEVVEYGCTERVCLHLTLPLDCPCSLETDMVRVSFRCRVDLTVADDSGGQSDLRLNLPVTVVHGPTSEEMDDEEDENQDDNMQHSLFSTQEEKDSFECGDIKKELKQLSLLLSDKLELVTGC